MTAKRVPIPQRVQDDILLANRHACCVCQKLRVQLHHIDGNPANNDPSNIAALCLDHHDMASMSIGLTKKLQPDQIRIYKAQWEEKCSKDITALSRKRFTFYYCIYKNPPRLLEAYRTLSAPERIAASHRIAQRLPEEEPPKQADQLFGLNAVPALDRHTGQALQSVQLGEDYPGYLGKFKPHPADPNYSTDSSTQEAMSAFHLYDLWCQVVAQVLAEARGTTPLEDLFRFDSENELDDFVGGLVTFRLNARGNGVHPPSMWKKYPVASIHSRVTANKRKIRVRMQLRTMYLFSDTAAVNLNQGRISGLGLFNGAVKNDQGEMELTVVPLLIGTGGWNLYPEKYPESIISKIKY